MSASSSARHVRDEAAGEVLAGKEQASLPVKDIKKGIGIYKNFSCKNEL